MRKLSARERVKHRCLERGCTYLQPVSQKIEQGEGWVEYWCTEDKCVYEEEEVLEKLKKEAEYLAETFGVDVPDVRVQTYLTPCFLPVPVAGRPLILLNSKAKYAKAGWPLLKQLYHEFKHYLQVGYGDIFEVPEEELKRYEAEAESFAEEWYAKGRVDLDPEVGEESCDPWCWVVPAAIILTFVSIPAIWWTLAAEG